MEMGMVYVIGGILVLVGLIASVVALYQHCQKTYDYNIFNWINLVLGITMFLLAAAYPIMMFFFQTTLAPLNYIIGGIVEIILLGIMFGRNLKSTSLPCTIGIIIIQIFCSIIIAFIIILKFMPVPESRE